MTSPMAQATPSTSDETTELGDVTPELVVVARLSEFFSGGTSWNRRLWTVGTPLLLREVAEYASGTRDGLMRPEGLTYVCSSAVKQVKRDKGLDSATGQAAIQSLLDAESARSPNSRKPEGLLDSAVATAFDQHIRRADTGYLSRWAGIVSSAPLAQSDAELVARLVGGYLLDAGFAPDHLHRWLKSRTREGSSLPEILEDADRMVEEPAREYEVWVLFQRIPSQVQVQAGDRFMTHRSFLEMLTERELPQPAAREGAGVLRFDVTAREPRAALVEADLAVRRLRARTVVGHPGERADGPSLALVANASRPTWHNLPRQGKVFLPSLRQHSGLFPTGPTLGRFEDALELLASVETSTTGASLASIWAALEGLLSRPGTEALPNVADRAADLVTCSLPVAELHMLRDQGRDGATYDSLADLFSAICDGSWEASNIRDHAAALRVISMRDDPLVLSRVRGYFRDAFRRLYNQRNFVMHGGRMDSIALPAAMRTMPSLVGASVDRIVHALSLDEPTDPLNLAARAANELDLYGSPGSRSLATLLL